MDKILGQSVDVFLGYHEVPDTQTDRALANQMTRVAIEAIGTPAEREAIEDLADFAREVARRDCPQLTSWILNVEGLAIAESEPDSKAMWLVTLRQGVYRVANVVAVNRIAELLMGKVLTEAVENSKAAQVVSVDEFLAVTEVDQSSAIEADNDQA